MNFICDKIASCEKKRRPRNNRKERGIREEENRGKGERGKGERGKVKGKKWKRGRRRWGKSEKTVTIFSYGELSVIKFLKILYCLLHPPNYESGAKGVSSVK